MTNLDLLHDLITQGQASNHADHVRIEARMQAMEDQVTSIRLWRAKVIGISAAISCLVSGVTVMAGYVISWLK